VFTARYDLCLLNTIAVYFRMQILAVSRLVILWPLTADDPISSQGILERKENSIF
jgi:hypothetical protein